MLNFRRNHGAYDQTVEIFVNLQDLERNKQFLKIEQTFQLYFVEISPFSRKDER